MIMRANDKNTERNEGKKPDHSFALSIILGPEKKGRHWQRKEKQNKTLTIDLDEKKSWCF